MDLARRYQRLEKILENALIKVSSVASQMDAVSVRDMVEALVAGERDGFTLAARGRRSGGARVGVPPAASG